MTLHVRYAHWADTDSEDLDWSSNVTPEHQVTDYDSTRCREVGEWIVRHAASRVSGPVGRRLRRWLDGHAAVPPLQLIHEFNPRVP